ncbi:MAG: hypothetical protein H0U66_05055 [Gemmatimonadaceae bacterium]|nr:hypothetical protein [Gemmatimonadaceae bacterium]
MSHSRGPQDGLQWVLLHTSICDVVRGHKGGSVFLPERWWRQTVPNGERVIEQRWPFARLVGPWLRRNGTRGDGGGTGHVH